VIRLGLACAEFFGEQNQAMHTSAKAFRLWAEELLVSHHLKRLIHWGILIWLMLLCLAAGAEEAKLPNYFLRSWKTDNLLPDNAVTAVVQTREGYLWIGTYGGLVRFDGVRFVVYNSASTPGLQSDRVTSLFEDDSGSLWIGHERGDLTRYVDGKFEAFATHEIGVRRKISGIGQTQDGEVWMLNEEGTLVRARDGATCALPNTDGVAEMAQDGQKQLWVTSGGHLAKLTGSSLEILTNTMGTNGVGDYVQGICASRDGGLWVVNNGEVVKWNGRAVTEDRGTNPCNTTVVAMAETKSGTLAMGTSSGGLYLLFTNRAVLHFNQENGFPNDWIRCVHEDREGTLWVGAGSVGLLALRPGKIQTLDAPDHWQKRMVLSTTVAKNGDIWVGTEGAGLYRFSDGNWTRYGESAGFSNMYVWSVTQDSQGRMWAGTWGGGMLRQAGDHFAVPPGLENVNVPMPAVLQTPEGVTWIGTASGLLRYEDGATKWYGERDGLKVPDVRTIVQDKNGTIWFGMLGGGLGKLQNGQVTQFLQSDGLSSDYVQCLHLGTGGELWIGTYGSGLARLKDGHFSKVTASEGLTNNFICSIEADQQGNYWISSPGGIFRVTESALNDCADGKVSSVNCLTFGEGDGMPSKECSGGLQPASCKLADGKIGFPTSKGLVIVNPEDNRINHLPPPVIIEDVIAGGRSFGQYPNNRSPLKIPPGSQRFEIYYTGLSYVAPEKMQFQYRMEGWEKDWVDAGSSKRMAEYNYLPPGDYTFHVRAGNSDGIWNQTGAFIDISVLPQFWQTWWFHSITLALGIALVAGVVLFITRRRMKLKLERIERQQALERERTRIAKDIHDHLGANLTRISLLSQSAHGDLENTKQAAAQLERIYDTSRELTRSMDEIVWAVNPQHDTLDSLGSYLGNFAQEYLSSINIRCRLDMPLHPPHWPISAEMRHNVFLAFKEALHNVIKHSGANEVSVLLATDDEGFTLALRDKGKGFDPATVPVRTGRGNGLKNMRQRLEKMGGRFEIKSIAGTGTEIKFVVSIPMAVRSHV